MSAPITAPAGWHLVILAHGLSGTGSDMAYIADCLRATHGSGVHVLQSVSNTGEFGMLSSTFRTAAGVQEGGLRLAEEVTRFMAAHSECTHISMIGTSLGGLFCRAAAPLILERLPMLIPANFITFATPHAGARNHLAVPLQLAVAAGAIGATGRDLMLRDEGGAGGVPVLQWMANPRSPHWQALSKFPNRVLFANLRDDDRVPYWSAAVAAVADAATGAGGSSASPSSFSCLQGEVMELPALGVVDPSIYPHIHSVRRQTWVAATSGAPPCLSATASLATAEVATQTAGGLANESPTVVVTEPASMESAQPPLDRRAGAEEAASPRGLSVVASAGAHVPTVSTGGSGAAALTVITAPLHVVGTTGVPAAPSGGGAAGCADPVPTRARAAFDAPNAVAVPMAAEASICRNLRAMGGFTTVDVLFTEWGASLLNHLRIGMSKPWLTGRSCADAVHFAIAHAFVHPVPSAILRVSAPDDGAPAVGL